MIKNFDLRITNNLGQIVFQTTDLSEPIDQKLIVQRLLLRNRSCRNQIG